MVAGTKTISELRAVKDGDRAVIGMMHISPLHLC
jgi:hypothetical protein